MEEDVSKNSCPSSTHFWNVVFYLNKFFFNEITAMIGKFPRNKFSHCFLNKATTPYKSLEENVGAGSQTCPTGKKRQYNSRKIKDVNDEWMRRDGKPQPMRPPNLSHHTTCTRDPRVPRQHLRKGMGCQHDAASRTNEVILGFPRHSEGWRRGSLDDL